MVVQAALDGIGVALGHSLMIARELEQGTLVTLFDSRRANVRKAPRIRTATRSRAHQPDRGRASDRRPAGDLLVTAVASREKPQVVAFRDWVFRQASSKTLDFRTGPIAPVTRHV